MMPGGFDVMARYSCRCTGARSRWGQSSRGRSQATTCRLTRRLGRGCSSSGSASRPWPARKPRSQMLTAVVEAWWPGRRQDGAGGPAVPRRGRGYGPHRRSGRHRSVVRRRVRVLGLPSAAYRGRTADRKDKEGFRPPSSFDPWISVVLVWKLQCLWTSGHRGSASPQLRSYACVHKGTG